MQYIYLYLFSLEKHKFWNKNGESVQYTYDIVLINSLGAPQFFEQASVYMN